MYKLFRECVLVFVEIKPEDNANGAKKRGSSVTVKHVNILVTCCGDLIYC